MIFERFRATAEQHASEPAIIDGGLRISYGRLLDEITRVRGWLKQALDPRPGETVAISMLNRWQFAASFLALCDSGAVLMPCNPQWRPEELKALAGRINLRGVVAERAFQAAWRETGAVPAEAIVGIEDAEFDNHGDWNRGASSTEAPVLFMTTSGSTGVPRIVPLSERNLIGSISNSSRAMGIRAGDRMIGVVPFHHLHGFNNCMLMPLLSGATVVMMQRFLPEEYAELAAREQVNVIIGSPFIYGKLAECIRNPDLFKTVRLCVSSGARMQPSIASRWEEYFGSTIVQWYGTTETSGISMAVSPGQPSSALGGEFVGVPLPNVQIRCVDSSGQDVGTGQPGEILARSPATMSGYFGEPELNRQVLADGFFRTGDLGYIDSARGLYLTGRLGRVINVGGIKVDPVEVERAIEALAGVSAVYVDSVPAPGAGQVIRARVKVREGAELARADVIRHCRARLGEYKLPRIIEFVDSIPVSLVGKTSRAVASGVANIASEVANNE
ncbi:MAG TPA: class I adenylate-forming enzyme family protein [Bryobacteraceae bacterium]|nr:class I adenylate-forming enzyme family protein [Bryobacteraceae bacterium]